MNPSLRSLIQSHPRRFAENRYVYPVLSRRSGGISIGVNLNPDKRCNFRCVYCQVDRRQLERAEAVDIERLRGELTEMIELVCSGRIYTETTFKSTPPPLRLLRDIAFSGDAEPTACGCFEQAVEAAAEARRHHQLSDVKLVLITNASLLDLPRVRRGLEVLDANNGEIWAKLDAGTEAYYRRVARSAVPFHRILDNILQTARVRPIVIQSLFMRLAGQGPSEDELEAYCRRLGEVQAGGGRIKLVQVYTVARPPAESWVSPLTTDQLEAVADLVRRRTGLSVATFGPGHAKPSPPGRMS